jgi:hypothetical protein
VNDICPMHAYTEQSARHKLERHRKRGDHTQVMRHCWCGAWHVGEIVEDVPSVTDKEET